MPECDAADRRSVRINAPADIAFAVACRIDIRQSRAVRAIFRLRELILRSRHAASSAHTGLIDWTRKLGWELLAETPGREIVMGAITQPWSADVVFRPIAPECFASYDEPDHVKIAWTIRAEPVGDTASVFNTETRVFACDAQARAKFRRYWRLFSPGIVLIRLALLRLLKKESERQARAHRYAAA